MGKSEHTERLGVTDKGLEFVAFRMKSGENWLVLIGDDTGFTPIEPWPKRSGGITLPAYTEPWDKVTGGHFGSPLGQMRKHRLSLPGNLGLPAGEGNPGERFELWGFDERGSFNAVCDFLRKLGMRWYLPGELGEIVPKLDSIPLPEIDETVRPDFPVRRFNVRFSVHGEETARWMMRLGVRDNGAELSAFSPTATGSLHEVSKFAHYFKGDHDLSYSEPEPDCIRLRSRARQLFKSDREGAVGALEKLAASEELTERQRCDALSLAAFYARRFRDFDWAERLAAAAPIEAVAKTIRMQNLIERRQFEEVIERFGAEDLSRWPFWAAAEGYFVRGLFRRIAIPKAYLATEDEHTFGGDVRIGDLNGDGRCDFLVYRSRHSGPSGPAVSGFKPCFLGAFDVDGTKLWSVGGGHGFGPEEVPHGQEVRVANLRDDLPGPEMALRHLGHTPDLMVVSSVDNTIVSRLKLNPSPTNVGMEPVYWNGPDRAALLYNGGWLWNLQTGQGASLPGLPPPNGGEVHRMGFHHAIAADLCGDIREELVLWDSTATEVFIYTQDKPDEKSYRGYQAGPRQYNPRIMD